MPLVEERVNSMKQNIYDNEDFFNQYEELRVEEKGKNANDLIEIPNFRRLMPDVKDKTILDLGCGYGESDKYYKELGAKYILGTDISSKMIEKANNQNKEDGIDYRVLAMEDLSELNQKFDIIMSSLAFHYVENFDKLISDCNSLLNKDGYLVFSQEHPLITSIKFTENVKKGHTVIDNKYFGIFSDYNRLGERKKEWFNGDVIKYHRNFEKIINTLINKGFTIEKVLEPLPSEHAIESNPKYVNQYDRPFFLFIRARKIDELKNERMNKKQLKELLDNFKLDKEEFTILSSSSLVLRDIYDSAGDLDIAVTKKGFEQLKQNYYVTHKENDWYKVSDNIECVLDDMKGKREKLGDYYLQDINDYYEYLKSSNREKDKLRIPLVEDYIKRHKS